LGDHLGSTSLTTNATGTVVSELRYKAWGEVRYASGNTLTQYTFTGQFSHVNDFGLTFYNARWLDVSLGRFAQADTITPKGVQGLDRYAYVNNSPVKYTDPSGHRACSTRQECKEMGITPSGKNFLDFTGYSLWERQILRELYHNGGPNAMHGVNYVLENSIHITSGSGWQTFGGNTGAWFDERSNTLILNADKSAGNFDANGQITLWGLSLVVHEAKHLEQGSNVSHSKLGEWDGWQVQVDVLKHLGFFPDPNNLPGWAKDIENAKTVEAFSAAVEQHRPGYWNRLHGKALEHYLCVGLCTYPDLPYLCMSIGTCPPEPAWWLRLDFTP
jgi:RHS repeat-associated protein